MQESVYDYGSLTPTQVVKCKVDSKNRKEEKTNDIHTLIRLELS